MKVEIRDASKSDSEILANIISKSNKEIALMFGLNEGNTPKHPSLCTKDWIDCDFQRGEIYFILEVNDVPVGCVAYEQPDGSTSYLNRLAVLPDYRNKGFGAKLVKYHEKHSKQAGVHKISIGIINKHALLKKWYINLGFKENEVKTLHHLPFDVCMLSKRI